MAISDFYRKSKPDFVINRKQIDSDRLIIHQSKDFVNILFNDWEYNFAFFIFVSFNERG